MDSNLLGNGRKIDFTQCKTVEELVKILDKIFTNNPCFWKQKPLYLNSSGYFNKLIEYILSGKVDVYEYTFPFTEPNEENQAEMSLYDYCWKISKVRTNSLLPLVYYNAFLYMDKLNLSIHNKDNTTKIMYVSKKNYSNTIFEEIGNHIYHICGNYYDVDWSFLGEMYSYDIFPGDSKETCDAGIALDCECGSVGAYRVEMGMMNGKNGYVIFPFPTENEEIGNMYYFKFNIDREQARDELLGISTTRHHLDTGND